MSQSTAIISSPAPVNQEDGYILISIDYSNKWILPLQDGLQLIASLRRAKTYKEAYKEETTIQTLPPVEFKFVTQEQYDAWAIQEILTL